MFSHFSQVLCIVIALVGGSGCFSSPTPHPVDPEDSRVVGVDTTDGLSNETGPPGTGNYDGDSDAQTGGAADARRQATCVGVGVSWHGRSRRSGRVRQQVGRRGRW